LNNSKATRPLSLKFSGKRYFHTKNIHLKFGCKRPSILKVIAPYSTTTEPKLAHCHPCAQTTESNCSIQQMLTRKVLDVLDSNFQIHNNLKIFLVNFGCKNFSFTKSYGASQSNCPTLLN